VAQALKLVPTSGWHPMDPAEAAEAVDRMQPAAALADDPAAVLALWRYQLLTGKWGMVQLCTGRDGTPVAGLIFRIVDDTLHIVALAKWANSDLDLITAADDAADELAGAYGLARVCMETVRPGVVKRVQGLAWDGRNIEVVRHVRR